MNWKCLSIPLKKQKQRVIELLKVSLNPETMILLIVYGSYFIR